MTVYFDAARHHIANVRVEKRDGWDDLAAEIVVTLDGAQVTLPDPVGLWERITDALLSADLDGIDRAWMHEHIGTDPKEKP